MSFESTTAWIDQLKQGNDEAARRLWNACFEDLIRQAAIRMQGFPRRVSDEEDVAQSVFLSLCRGAAAGRFPKLNDRADLWQILIMLTHQKIVDRVRKELRQKRGGGQVQGESAWMATPDGMGGLDELAFKNGTDEYSLEFAETLQELLQQLHSDSLRQVAMYRFEGYSNSEIAEKMGLTSRSVERKLQQIREVWGRSQERP